MKQEITPGGLFRAALLYRAAEQAVGKRQAKEAKKAARLRLETAREELDRCLELWGQGVIEFTEYFEDRGVAK